jgi:hypothetical protein
VLIVAFLVYELPPYLAFDPALARLPEPADKPWHFPMLVAHILFGSVALLAGCLQIWPWLRARHPRVHRWSGRMYLFAGVFPAGVAVLGVAPWSSSGFVSSVGNTLLAVLWLLTGIAGWRAARARQYARHRMWMIRSYALTTSIVLNRVWVVVAAVALQPALDGTFGGSEAALFTSAAQIAVWCSWVVNLLVAQWWLDRHPLPGRRPHPGGGTLPDAHRPPGDQPSTAETVSRTAVSGASTS